MENLFEFSPIVVAIVPIIVGLVQVAKGLKLPKQYTPLLALLLGIALMMTTSPDWRVFTVQGVIAGLAASGLWSGAKTSLKIKK